MLAVLIVFGLGLIGYIVTTAYEPATKPAQVYIEYDQSNRNDGLVLVYDPDTGDCKVIKITQPAK